ncbi:GLPGLI family protein [Niabella sp. 22666]|uniref:GLPGLI family protein n=1 Tax=Niabella sp. 22666 TaxID=3453954 RepID=UPI003F82D026
MMKQLFLLTAFLYTGLVQAQKFVTSGTIEFEVKTNLQKSLSSMAWDDDDNSFFKQIIASQPQFTLNYYKYSFSDNKANYKFDRNADTKKVSPWFSNINEDDLWYSDYTNKKFANLKAIDDNYLITGDLKNVKWKLYPNDNTQIAGFNCRRASAILFDSVYVFAYYTDEIAISGGPMSVNGLPGMILGLTIPRMYTSWIATTLTLDKPEIKEPIKGKKKTEAELQTILTDLAKSRVKEWGKNSAKWMNQMIWRTFL